MKIEKINIKKLVSPSYNPRDISPAEMEKLKRSITEFGYVDPIIVNDVNMHIVGGNQRYYAMKELNFKEVEVSFVHIEDLNREKALNVALNKISGDWDFDKLDDLLIDLDADGFDITLTGFELEDLENILNGDDGFVEEITSDDYQKILYEPKNTNHSVRDLFEMSDEFEEIIDNIEDEDLREMFNIRKHWFCKFNFSKIADYYAYQATPDEQRVFEKLGLVLLDKQQLLENGFQDILDEFVEDDEITEE